MANKLHRLPSAELTSEVALHMVLEHKPKSVVIAYSDHEGNIYLTWSNQTSAEFACKTVFLLGKAQDVVNGN